MSDDMQKKIDELQKENVNLKTQMQKNGEGTTLLQAQLDAHKGMLNENLNASLNLRTQLALLSKQANDLNATNETLKRQVESLNQQLSDATKKIADLENPVVPAN